MADSTFIPSPADRADLIAAGWKPPPQALPQMRRVRVELGQDGAVYVFGLAVPVHTHARATAIVTLIEGVFDEEGKR